MHPVSWNQISLQAIYRRCLIDSVVVTHNDFKSSFRSEHARIFGHSVCYDCLTRILWWLAHHQRLAGHWTIVVCMKNAARQSKKWRMCGSSFFLLWWATVGRWGLIFDHWKLEQSTYWMEFYPCSVKLRKKRSHSCFKLTGPGTDSMQSNHACNHALPVNISHSNYAADIVTPRVPLAPNEEQVGEIWSVVTCWGNIAASISGEILGVVCRRNISASIFGEISSLAAHSWLPGEITKCYPEHASWIHHIVYANLLIILLI